MERYQFSTLQKAIKHYLMRNDGPRSINQIAGFFSIDRTICPALNKDHNTLLIVVDYLLGLKILDCAYYPGNPPPPYHDAFVGPGTYGYYPVAREQEFIGSGVLIDTQSYYHKGDYLEAISEYIGYNVGVIEKRFFKSFDLTS